MPHLGDIFTPTMAHNKHFALLTSHRYYNLPFNVYTKQIEDTIFYCITLNNFVAMLLAMPELGDVLTKSQKKT